MREIKFRGKAKHPKRNGEWLYGYLLTLVDGNGEVYIFDGDFEDMSQGETCDEWNEVIPESAGQLVGIKDKNGKEVYEGDICKPIGPYIQNFEVEMSPFFWHDLIEFGVLYELEVIGNIYENPELLKVL